MKLSPNMLPISSSHLTIGAKLQPGGDRSTQCQRNKACPDRNPGCPAHQQQRIVAEIEKQFSRLDEAVASLKRGKANLKRYKASVLKAAVEGKLTEDWRKRHPDVEPASNFLERILLERRAKWSGRGKYKEPETPDATGLPSLPKGWTWATVDQVAAPEPNSLTDGPFGFKPQDRALQRNRPSRNLPSEYRRRCVRE